MLGKHVKGICGISMNMHKVEKTFPLGIATKLLGPLWRNYCKWKIENGCMGCLFDIYITHFYFCTKNIIIEKCYFLLWLIWKFYGNLRENTLNPISSWHLKDREFVWQTNSVVNIIFAKSIFCGKLFCLVELASSKFPKMQQCPNWDS